MTSCGAKTKGTGKPCRRPAGWGTDHPGYGKCKLHGGATPIKHGRYSLSHRQSLAAKVAHFLSDSAPGDLTSELALTRSLLQEYLDRYPEGEELSVDSLHQILSMVGHISRLVERISKMLNETALTQADLLVLRAGLTDLLVKYIDDPDRRIAVLGELRALVGVSRPDSTD